MKYRFTFFVLFFASILSALSLTAVNSSQARALTGADWNAGNIIADSVFYDNTSMSVGDIQSYLNNKVPTCDTNGTQSAADLKYPNMNHAQYAAMMGWPGPPYICLKDYYQVPRSDTIINNFSGSIPAGAISAAQIIKNAADSYGVSPKTLIVLLTKESPGPITLDSWPIQSQYKNAMGYACPDTAPCDPAYAGFYNQVMNAAKRIQTYKQYPTSYRHQPYRNNNVYYNPNLSGCGASTVYIQGFATAGLYNYTPYQPNQAALDNLYGAGDGCSAYGNRNFWRIYNDWFGSTSGTDLSWLPADQRLYYDSGRTQPLPYNAVLSPGQKVYGTVTAKNTGNLTWSNTNMRLATSNTRDRSSPFSNEDWPSSNRVAGMQQASVSPGQNATFSFSLTAPSKLGDYREYFSLVADGAGWLNDPGLYFPITVADTRSIQLYSDVSRSTPVSGSFYTGSILYGKLTIRNNLGSPITKGTAIATTGPQDRNSQLYNEGWVGTNRVAKLTDTIPVGGTGEVLFQVTTPSTPTILDESFGLVLDGVGWVERDSMKITGSVVQKPADTLPSGERLASGKQLSSSNGTYRLVMQDDGNLVIYSPNRPIWASNTRGSGADTLVMQTDSNLVIYAPGRPVWAIGTVGAGGKRLVMQNDGNLVIYANDRSIWASNTAGIR